MACVSNMVLLNASRLLNFTVKEATEKMNRKEMLARLKKGEDPLEVSILKWQDIAKGKDMNLFGSSNCALCEVHQNYDNCGACPIDKGVGCEDTPFEDYEAYIGFEGKDCDGLKELAQKEVEFLKSLRKEVEE